MGRARGHNLGSLATVRSRTPRVLQPLVSVLADSYEAVRGHPQGERDHGPTTSETDADGNQWFRYLEHGQLHREDGPAAYGRYGYNGEIFGETYYLNGQQLNYENWLEQLERRQQIC
jgi:hypothetical protein